MKVLVSDFADKLRAVMGDSIMTTDDDLILAAINWALKSLPSVPKLYLAWPKHLNMNLDAKGHYKWEFSKGKVLKDGKETPYFQDIVKFDYVNFFTSTGGDPCPLEVCYRHPIPFFKKNGLPEIKVAGMPCEYTREREGDTFYLVLDRPSNVPIIVDYVCYGRLSPVTSFDDEFDCPAVVENLMLAATRRVLYQESADFAFAADISNYLDNKEIVEAVQELTRENSNDSFTVLGESGR